MTGKTISQYIVVGLAAAAFAPGCTELDLTDEVDIGDDSYEVKDGIATFPFSNRAVRVNGCTGTLISDQWVLTAGHCFSSKSAKNVMVTFSSETRSADRVLYHPRSSVFTGDGDSNVDAALVHLAAPFSLSPTTGEPAIFEGETDTLYGDWVQCYGYGAEDIYGSCSDSSDCNSGDWCQWGKCMVPSNVLRTANFTVKADPVNSDVWFRLDVPNADGQLLLPGDSGGACYRYGTSEIVGVLKAGNGVNYNRETSGEAFGDWADDKRDAPIYDVAQPNASLCTAAQPCDIAEGDCDNDSQCRGDLVCGHDVGARYGLPANWDVCEAPLSCPNFTLSAQDAQFCANSNCPCSFAEGDCDDDFECGGSLVCRHNVGAAVFLPADYDICTYPAAPGCPVYDASSPNASQCTPDCPCGPGEGDCDSNDDCMDGFVCGTDNGASYGLPGTYDVCVKPRLRINPGVIKYL